MLRNLINKIQSFRSGFPVRAKKAGHYRVRATWTRDGRHEISARSIALVIIAEKIGTDDPQQIGSEITRQRFINLVRQKSAEQEILRTIENADPPGRIVSFVEAKNRIKARRSGGCTPSANCSEPAVEAPTPT